MKLLKYNILNSKGLFECSKCEHLAVYKAKRRAVCPACGDVDSMRQAVRYAWLSRPVGYSRLFPPEEIKKAKASIERARAQGMVFACVDTFAGLRVCVLSLPPRPTKTKNFPD